MFGPLAGNLIADLVLESRLASAATIVDLGNQTYDVDHGSLGRIINKCETMDDRRASLISTEVLRSFLSRPVRYDGSPTVKEFYRALGFSEYVTIDLGDRYGSLLMDLNYDLREKYSYDRKFDLVTNIGVSEHVFNQAAFFKNVHQLAKEGGIILCMLPCFGYINHCFYSYHPRFFDDLAASNGYELVGLYLSERDRILADLQKPSEVCLYFPSHVQTLARNPLGNVFVVAVMKVGIKAEFLFPMQGRYLEDIRSEQAKGDYRNQTRVASQGSAMGFFSENCTKQEMSNYRSGVRIKMKRSALNVLRAAMRLVIKYT